MHPPPPLDLPQRVLLGPGPSDVAPSVLRALAQPTLGHLDPRVLAALEELAGMLRALFATRNERTLAVSGTGTAAMEAALVNLIEPGDAVLVAVHGYFGARLVEMAARCGAEVTAVEATWGGPSDVDALRRAARGRRFALVCGVHAETSTGVLQPLEPLRELADELGALLLVDAVTSLGCVPLELDARGVDAAYSCSQKGLSCPPGLSPLSLSARALEKLGKRAGKVRSFYLDADLLQGYWSGGGYHHTAASNLIAALHEGARLALAEGLEQRFARHRLHGRALAAGLEALGLELLAPASHRLPQLTAVRIPDGVDDARARRRLLEQDGIEIGGGLGPLKGGLWRIGLMGAGSTRRNVLLALAALSGALAEQGFRAGGADALSAAEQVLARGEGGA